MTVVYKKIWGVQKKLGVYKVIGVFLSILIIWSFDFNFFLNKLIELKQFSNRTMAKKNLLVFWSVITESKMCSYKIPKSNSIGPPFLWIHAHKFQTLLYQQLHLADKSKHFYWPSPKEGLLTSSQSNFLCLRNRQVREYK